MKVSTRMILVASLLTSLVGCEGPESPETAAQESSETQLDASGGQSVEGERDVAPPKESATDDLKPRGREQAVAKPPTSPAKEQRSIEISAPGVSWLPMETGTGFFGATSYETPDFDVHYEKQSYRDSEVRLVYAININVPEKGVVRYSMYHQKDIVEPDGQFRASWSDPTGQFELSGQGELEVFLSDPDDEKKVLSNVIRIPLAIDEVARKKLEARYGPMPDGGETEGH